MGFPYLLALARARSNRFPSPVLTTKGTYMPEQNPTGISDNSAGALSYLTIVPAIVFLVLPPYNANAFVRFHSWQSIFLNISAIVISIILSIFLAFSMIFGAFLFVALTRLIWVFWILIWILCAVNALNGKRFKLPIIGNIAENLANK
jgi:uncharacterized membrane protein